MSAVNVRCAGRLALALVRPSSLGALSPPPTAPAPVAIHRIKSRATTALWCTRCTRQHAVAAASAVAAAAAPSTNHAPMTRRFSAQHMDASTSPPVFAAAKPPTGVVMLNMGGPADPSHESVGDFLARLFGDREIIDLGRLQNWGKFIAKRRTPRIAAQYAVIGGSPIRRWTEQQGRAMVQRLDKISPATAPHAFYIAFRYAPPLTADTIAAMQRDGVQRAVAFSQYPQFSCTTAGSSLNHLWRELQRLDAEHAFKWSVIDRWPTHPLFVAAVAQRIKTALCKLGFPLPGVDPSIPVPGVQGPETGGVAPLTREQRDGVVIVFSAHSLPMRVVNRADPYSVEVAATVHAVMQHLHADPDMLSAAAPLRHVLAWQSQVGYLPWLGPKTGDVLTGLGRQGHKHVVVVPIAFTSDHIETLYEIDVEYAHVAKKAGITSFLRAPALNDEPLLADAMAELVAGHLNEGWPATPQYALTCAGCVNPMCRSIINPAAPYAALRTRAGVDPARDPATSGR